MTLGLTALVGSEKAPKFKLSARDLTLRTVACYWVATTIRPLDRAIKTVYGFRPLPFLRLLLRLRLWYENNSSCITFPDPTRKKNYLYRGIGKPCAGQRSTIALPNSVSLYSIPFIVLILGLTAAEGSGTRIFHSTHDTLWDVR